MLNEAQGQHQDACLRLFVCEHTNTRLVEYIYWRFNTYTKYKNENYTLRLNTWTCALQVHEFEYDLYLMPDTNTRAVQTGGNTQW